MKPAILCFGLALVAAGCASSQGATGPANTPDNTREVASTSQTGLVSDVPGIGLPAQTLAIGECGLFLWSQTDLSRFTFFAKAGASEALLLFNGAPTDLALTATRGDIFGQFLTDLTYRIVSTGQEITVTYTPGEPLEGGARVSSGRISYKTPDGWTTVLPVVGVRACQLQPPPDTEPRPR
ncbi:MAG: hypothetical protein AAGK23_11560 [Pseudomonadota bacterium]